jgi:azurin
MINLKTQIENMKKSTLTTLIIGAVFFFSSCGGSEEKKESNKDESANAKIQETVASIPDSVSLTIEGNDLMQFNLDQMEVIEGQVVTVTIKHVGEMSVDVMGHNWVLLAVGTNVDAFGGASAMAKQTDYIPADMKDQVIANTATVGGGQEASITFTAPEAGYYTFICSFPGHYGVMQGTFVSNPR